MTREPVLILGVATEIVAARYRERKLVFISTVTVAFASVLRLAMMAHHMACRRRQ